MPGAATRHAHLWHATATGVRMTDGARRMVRRLSLLSFSFYNSRLIDLFVSPPWTPNLTNR